MPGEALLALLEKAGLQQAKLAVYTGMKSSPYTEGALLSADKPGLGLSREAGAPTHESQAASPEPTPSCQPAGSCQPGGT
jgi:transcriptional regulator with XRE-family HTH domain